MFGKQGSGNLCLIGLGWLGVALVIFMAQLLSKPTIVIFWTTGSELETVGFHVYRSESINGPFNRVNQTLITAHGSSIQGDDYHFIDRAVVTGTTYFYQLEEVELDASVTRYTNETITHRAVRFSWWEMGLTAVSAIIGILLLTTSQPNSLYIFSLPLCSFASLR